MAPDEYYRSTVIRETRHDGGPSSRYSAGPGPQYPGDDRGGGGSYYASGAMGGGGGSSNFQPDRPRTRSGLRRRLPEDDIDEFFARNGLPERDTLGHCMHYAQSRLPQHTVVEPMRTQGYCSLTLLAATEPIASIIQFRPENHRLDVALAEDARAVFGPVVPHTRSMGYLFLPGVREHDEEEEHEHRGLRRRVKDKLKEKIFHRHRRDDDDDDDDDDHKHHFFRRHSHERERSSERRRGGGREEEEEENRVVLHVYSMSFLPGTPLTTHRLARLPPDVAGAHRAALVRSLAHHFSVAWRNGRYPDAPRRPQTMVASSIRGRLEAMTHVLPPRFRGSAAQVLARLPQIEALPWVLTHGDLVPVNVLVDPQRGSITGLIDWAESEYLPFGTGLYALEELLSHAATLPEEEGPDGRGKRWGYYPDISALRELFWSELLGMVPELREGGTMETVRLAGQMGVLLWCGMAFDDGRLDRIVQEGRDATEIAKLDLFLLSPEGCKDMSILRMEEQEPSDFGPPRGGGGRGRRNPHEEAFFFAKTDDEENVQELGNEPPIRHRL